MNEANDVCLIFVNRTPIEIVRLVENRAEIPKAILRDASTQTAVYNTFEVYPIVTDEEQREKHSRRAKRKNIR